MHQSRQTLFIIVSVVVIISIIVGLYTANYMFSRNNPGGVDFLPRWMGARFWLIEGISPYDEKVSLATQIALYGHPARTTQGEGKGYFLYPLPLMILIAPFGFFDYLQARALWMTLSEVIFVWIIVLGFKLTRRQGTHIGLILLSCIFLVILYPNAKAIINGHIVIFDMFFMILGIYLIVKKQDFPAGLVLSLPALKPDFSFLVILFIIAWCVRLRRYELVYGLLGGGGLLYAISLLFINDWPLQQLRQLWAILPERQSLLNIISQQAPGIQKQLNWILTIAIIFYLLFEWYKSFKEDESYLIWCCVVTMTLTCFVYPYVNIANYVLLVPSLVLIFRIVTERWGRFGFLIIGLSIIGLGLGLWWILLHSNSASNEPFSIYIVLPSYTLVGLWWVRWWALHPPRVFLEEISKNVE